MAIDFPSNPTNGQVYSNWIYDSSITAWRNVNTDTGIGTLNAMGLKNVVPTSVAVGSGSATTNANGTVTFSAASSISLNGVFGSTYTNYRIVLRTVLGSGSNISLSSRLRAAGSDNSSVVYSYAQPQANNTAGFVGASDTNVSSWVVSRVTGSTGTVNVLDIFQPQILDATHFTNTFFYDTGTGFLGGAGGGKHNASYQADGITIFPGSGTISGTMTVYGYTN